jgi:hypothetical protein
MKLVLSDCLWWCTSPAIRLWMTRGWLRMTPGVRLQRKGLPEQRLTSGLPKPITAPCGSLTQCTRWRSRAATWVSLMTPQRNAAEV